MHGYPMRFKDRVQAGRELANALKDYADKNSIVMAIPRGGVVVGYEVALALNIEMDVVVPRKIGAPGQQELAIGAVAGWWDEGCALNKELCKMLSVSDDYIKHESKRQLEEVNRRLLAYRGTVAPPTLTEKTVLLVDDGVATGYTTRAAAKSLRNINAKQIILAVPVGPPDSLEELESFVDKIICLKTPEPFYAVGNWYDDFDQVEDREVIRLLTLLKNRQI